MRRSEAFVREAVADKLAPDVAGAVGAAAAVNVGAVIADGNFDEADPLADFSALVVAVRRYREFGVDCCR